MPDISLEKFLVLLKSYRIMIHEGYNDAKGAVMLGSIQPVLAEFLGWLADQKSFKQIEDLPLKDFVVGMRKISPLGESALIELEKQLVAKAAKPNKEEPGNGQS